MWHPIERRGNDGPGPRHHDRQDVGRDDTSTVVPTPQNASTGQTIRPRDACQVTETCDRNGGDPSTAGQTRAEKQLIGNERALLVLIERLTPTQHRVAKGLVEYPQHGARTVAELVGLSYQAFKKHRTRIYRKLQVEGRLDLYVLYRDALLTGRTPSAESMPSAVVPSKGTALAAARRVPTGR